MSTSIPSCFSSPSAIRSHASTREDGNGKRWFSKDTMKWHAKRLTRGIAKGTDGRWYFVVSNDPGASIGHPARCFAVCAYDAAGNRVETLATLDVGHTAAQARAEMNRLARAS